MFGSSSGFGIGSTSTEISSGCDTASFFGFSSQPATSCILGFGFGSSSPSPATDLSFGGSSSAVSAGSKIHSSHLVQPPHPQIPVSQFGSSASSIKFGQSQASTFTCSSSLFGSSSPATKMYVEDIMDEDTAHASTPSVSPPSDFIFGSPAPSRVLPFQFGSQQSLATPQNPSPFQDNGNLEFNVRGSFSLGTGALISLFGDLCLVPHQSPPSNFMFGSPAPSGALPLQFGGSQQNLAIRQNPSPFQATGNLKFNAGGSFSLETGGTNKSGRKFVKARRDKSRKR